MGLPELKHPGEMVPTTVRAHLYDVTRKRPDLTAKFHELVLRGYATPVCGKSFAKHVGNVDEGMLLANRARVFPLGPDVLCGPDELRMSVADVASRKASSMELRNEVTPRQSVVDGA